MPQWTDEQLEAINCYGRPVIVSAAAGSGKTAVLVERTIRLLCDEKLAIPADTLLAVTFTNDAAAQMREKLSAALENAAIEMPENAWIQKQQTLLRLANICTINSFCYDMVKNNLADTDLQSGVRIMEEKESDMVTERALDAVMEDAYEKFPQETEKLISLFCCEDDKPLREMIISLRKFLRSIPFSDVWVKNVTERLDGMQMISEIMADYAALADERAERCASTAERLRGLAEDLENYSKAKAKFLQNCDYAERILNALERAGDDMEACGEVLSSFSWIPMTGTTRTKQEKEDTTYLEEETYEEAKTCLSALKNAFSELAECYAVSEDEAKKDCAFVSKVFKQLLEFVNKLEENVWEIKVERNAIDFSDTELLTVNLLLNCDSSGRTSRTPIAEEIYRSGRYKLILVDEFQDVNNLQEAILKAVSDTDSMESIGSNVFAVGDVKQSIYRFRQANPKIFMQTRRLAEQSTDDKGVKEILLTKNFRSRAGVLDFANYLFSSLMNSRLGEVEYTKDEELVCGAKFIGDDRPTALIRVNSDLEEQSPVAFDEFAAVAAQIKKMLDEKTPVNDGGIVRPCRPSDFCVLTRNNITGDELVKRFSERGLKVASENVSGYLESREISLMLNLLKISVSPMKDIPLASVMLSPIMGFSDEDVALIKLHNKKNRLYKNMLEVADSEREKAGHAELVKKCESAISLVKKLKVYSASMPLTGLIKKIYDATDVFAMAAAYEDGKQKCANLYLLLEYAKNYENSSNEGVAGFLQYVSYILKTGGDFAKALTVTESDDAVVVKTMHRSKGLEFPFVFLCQLTKKFNFSDTHEKLLLNADYGVGLSYYDYSTLTRRKTVLSEYIKRKNTEELLSEELRLLYVAATRAKEQLFVVLDITSRTCENAKQYAYYINDHMIPCDLSEKAKCMQDWIVMAMTKDSSLCTLFGREYNEQDYYDFDTPDLKIITPEADTEQETGEQAADVGVDSALAEKIVRCFSYKNDQRLCATQAKVSVSELVKDDAINFFPKVADLDGTVTELTAAQKGTIMHRFMQLADYGAAAKDIESEISRLQNSGALSKIEADSINRDSLKAFFDGEIYKRMSRSENVMREKSFIVKFSDINVDEELSKMYDGTDGMLQGIADCIFEEDDGYVLVDYKTDRVKTLDELVQRYSAQLVLYKAAFDILLDKPVKSCCIYSYRLSSGIEAKLIGGKGF